MFDGEGCYGKLCEYRTCFPTNLWERKEQTLEMQPAGALKVNVGSSPTASTKKLSRYDVSARVAPRRAKNLRRSEAPDKIRRFVPPGCKFLSCADELSWQGEEPSERLTKPLAREEDKGAGVA